MLASLASLAAVGLAASAVLAAPITLTDGFPSPNAAQLATIEQKAFGTLSNSSVPATITADSLTNFKLLSFSETVEVVFYTEFLNNVTNNVPGYEISDSKERDFVIAQLTATVAQEQLHQLTAVGAVAHFAGAGAAILPCGTYNFPVSNITQAFDLAAAFTSVVLGVLQDVIFHFAENGDVAFTRPLASVVGNEAEQEGWYRLTQGKIPNELPFLTTGIRDFGFTAMQSFVDVSTCPNLNEINLTTYKTLDVVDTPTNQSQNIRYAVAASDFQNATDKWVAYINQLNVPVVQPLTVVEEQGDSVIVEAWFPYAEHEMNGLTLVSITNCSGPFATAQDVANAAVFAPGIIIVN